MSSDNATASMPDDRLYVGWISTLALVLKAERIEFALLMMSDIDLSSKTLSRFHCWRSVHIGKPKKKSKTDLKSHPPAPYLWLNLRRCYADSWRRDSSAICEIAVDRKQSQVGKLRIRRDARQGSEASDCSFFQLSTRLYIVH